MKDDVVGVFLQRVVDARLEIGLRAVVIDSQAAADVEIFQPGALLVQLGVNANRFVQRTLDLTDVGDLAAQVKVEQLEAIFHSAGFELGQRSQDLADRQAEFRTVSARRLPAAAAAGGQLHAHAEHGANADLLGEFEDQFQLGVFFDDGNDLAADLVGQRRHFDELGIFETVADDRRVVVGHRHDGQQLRLAAGFQSESKRLAEAQHFFDHLALLVDLDRIDAAVAAVVFVLGDRAGEGVVDFAQAMLQNAGEANQDRQIDAPQLQAVDKLLQIQKPLRIASRMDQHVP